MGEPSFYHKGARRLQERFDSRRIADRLEQVQVHDAFTDDDRAMIEQCAAFFLATADEHGRPDCSHKAGLPGFVRITGDRSLAFPSYDGNGMFRSLGNIAVNPHVGILVVDFERPRRLRLNGRARLSLDDPLMEDYVGAQLVVHVDVERIFPNCPRYVHPMVLVEHSVYVPRPGYRPPGPEWKAAAEFRDALPASDRDGEPEGAVSRLTQRARRHTHRKVVRVRKGSNHYLRRLENWLATPREQPAGLDSEPQG